MRTILLISTLALAYSAGAQTVKLVAVPQDFVKQMGGYIPKPLPLSATKPSAVTKLPDGLTNAKYATVTLGSKTYTFCVGDLPGKPAQLFVDTEGRGDLSSAGVGSWTTHNYSIKGTALQIHMGSAKVGFHLAGSKDPVQLRVYEFDPKDPVPSRQNALFCYADYGFTGQVTLGGTSYPFLLTDDSLSGFARSMDPAHPLGHLLIDRNNDGKFLERGKMYDKDQPFNVGGKTYDLASVNLAAGTAKFEVSKTTVAEIPMPQSFKVGSAFPGFTATTMTKNDVNFPTSYKGHIVMLDFWATWCGPCMGEVPNITATYEKYHEKGFDILGVSLDQKDSAQKVIDTAKSKNMTWPQIYDGGYWQAAIAVKYGIDSIPHAFLVDGDTGELLAHGDELRGDGLEKAVEQALTKKGLLKSK